MTIERGFGPKSEAGASQDSRRWKVISACLGALASVLMVALVALSIQLNGQIRDKELKSQEQIVLVKRDAKNAVAESLERVALLEATNKAALEEKKVALGERDLCFELNHCAESSGVTRCDGGILHVRTTPR